LTIVLEYGNGRKTKAPHPKVWGFLHEGLLEADDLSLNLHVYGVIA